ncbi:unnamed protein product [Phytophthora fragariaefolia]|uniref:Unnamed protein product n=1 Tax=Phytophthora fragariaefolia TaxID=1490495 RepID=A0A9W6WVD4_9STRA|nr:unnamed protein product [Phytophthora fragariaefolia]
MDYVQVAAAATANAVLPGSGSFVNGAFELGKICFEIAELLSGMQESASSISTQSANIEKDVAYFRWVLEVLGRVQHKSKLTNQLQKLIITFETEVEEYDRVVKKFLGQNVLKQLVFHNELDDASATVKEIAGQLVQYVTTECAINGSATYGHVDQVDERANRYMKMIDSPDVMKEMSDSDNQKEILAIIARIARRNEAMMHSSLEANDLVLNVVKEKLWASSSRAVQDEVKNLPDWYITEDEVEIDMSTVIGFGGDAKIYKGVLEDGTPVAVKVFNAHMCKSEEAKNKFFNTMKLWVRVSHLNNICRVYGACYFTASPFIVMEHCELGSLDTFLRQDGIHRCKHGIEMLTQAARAIVKMHSKGFVHGDLKCDNILVSASAGGKPQAKICDFDRSFDWSALKDERLVTGTAASAGIEITDAVRYLAPECVEGMLPNSKSDVYSFGMTLYHALVGISPYFEISSDKELRACKLARELPPRNMQSISDDAWKLIMQCCDPSPALRPTMEKVVEALKLLAEQLPTIEIPVKTRYDTIVDVQSDQINVLVSTTRVEGTLVKSMMSGSQALPASYKKTGIAVICLVVVAIIVGVVLGLKPFSSKSSADSSSGTGSMPSSSSSSGAVVSLVTSDDSSAASTHTPTVLLGLQVSTISTYIGDNSIWGIAVASSRQTFVSGPSEILEMTGNNAPTWHAGNQVTPGYQDGGLQQATFHGKGPLAVGPNDDLFLCDFLKVRKITSTNVSTVATLTSSMQGVAVDSSGNLYVTRFDEFDVVKITPDGNITDFANTSILNFPLGITIDSSDNIYITGQHRVMKFTSTGEMSVVAGSEVSGFVNGVGESARFNNPFAVTVGSDENLYVADRSNHCIRKIDLTTREVTTYAGMCTTPGSANGLATNAMFDTPLAIAAAADNVFYVTDGPYGQGTRLRKIYSV